MNNKTVWGTAKPGNPLIIHGPGEDEIIIADAPDWVRLPPELGGHEMRVIDHYMGPCPMDTTHDAHHYHLTGTIQVAHCPIHELFVWYKLQE